MIIYYDYFEFFQSFMLLCCGLDSPTPSQSNQSCETWCVVILATVVIIIIIIIVILMKCGCLSWRCKQRRTNGII